MNLDRTTLSRNITLLTKRGLLETLPSTGRRRLVQFPPSLQGKYGKAFFLSPSNSVCKESLTARRDFEMWFKEQGIRCEGGDQFGHPSIGPLRYAAMMAGLGIIRKNNFFKKELFMEALRSGFFMDYIVFLRIWIFL